MACSADVANASNLLPIESLSMKQFSIASFPRRRDPDGNGGNSGGDGESLDSRLRGKDGPVRASLHSLSLLAVSLRLPTFANLRCNSTKR